jgi:gas vesicle protein
MEDRTTRADFLAGFILGGLVGAAAALLLTPQSGQETRAFIRDRGTELQERSVEMTAQTRKRAQDLQSRAGGSASEWQNRMKRAVAEGRTAGEQRKSDLLTGLDAEEPASPQDSVDQDLGDTQA